MIYKKNKEEKLTSISRLKRGKKKRNHTHYHYNYFLKKGSKL